MARQPYKPSATRSAKIALDKNSSRQIGVLEPTLCLVRLVKDGPIVPAAIYLPCPWVEPGILVTDAHPDDWCRPMDRPRHFRAMVNGLPADPWRVWTTWHETIDTAEYAYRVATAEWARRYDPTSPEADAFRPIIKPVADAPPERRQAVALASHPTLF